MLVGSAEEISYKSCICAFREVGLEGYFLEFSAFFPYYITNDFFGLYGDDEVVVRLSVEVLGAIEGDG